MKDTRDPETLGNGIKHLVTQYGMSATVAADVMEGRLRNPQTSTGLTEAPTVAGGPRPEPPSQNGSREGAGP